MQQEQRQYFHQMSYRLRDKGLSPHGLLPEKMDLHQLKTLQLILRQNQWHPQ